MVKRELFKTCDQSGFCKRNRHFADTVAADKSWSSPYVLDPATIKFGDGQLTGVILKTIENDEKVRLPVIISFLETGTARVTIDEEKRQKGEITLRHDSKARKERYNEAGNWAIVGSLKGSKKAKIATGAEKGTTVIDYGKDGIFQAVVTHAPFGVSFKRNGITEVQLNEGGLLNMEHWRPQPPTVPDEPKEGEEATEEQKNPDTSTWFEESFGGATDTKPRGPESIGLDISFPGYNHVYGIPEHASSMSLKQTR
jgi:alpha 1,3-glucosidase